MKKLQKEQLAKKYDEMVENAKPEEEEVKPKEEQIKKKDEILKKEEIIKPKEEEINQKAHITNAKNHVELKGVDAFKITNNSHVVFLTNNDNSVTTEVGDRRFAAIECYDNLANDEKYILPLVDEIK